MSTRYTVPQCTSHLVTASIFARVKSNEKWSIGAIIGQEIPKTFFRDLAERIYVIMYVINYFPAYKTPFLQTKLCTHNTNNSLFTWNGELHSLVPRLHLRPAMPYTQG